VGHLRFGQAFITGEVAAHGSPVLVLLDQKGIDRAELNINSKGESPISVNGVSRPFSK
jgi:hypothetical protein